MDQSHPRITGAFPLVKQQSRSYKGLVGRNNRIHALQEFYCHELKQPAHHRPKGIVVLLAHKYKLNSVCNAGLWPAARIPASGIPKGIRTKINYNDSLAQDVGFVNVKIQYIVSMSRFYQNKAQVYGTYKRYLITASHIQRQPQNGTSQYRDPPY